MERLVELLKKDALLVPGRADTGGVIPDDPQDEMVLACAVDGQADLIVSGDHHPRHEAPLLDLGKHQGISIVTAREFLERLVE